MFSNMEMEECLETREFVKLRALRAFVPSRYTRLRTFVPYAPSCLHALCAFVPYVLSRLTCLELYAS